MDQGKRLSKPEFIALVAMLFATIAFSIDAMLPALPEIGAELSPDALNRAQLVLTSFVLGMGVGTFITGPLSDAFGRKPVLLTGSALYIGAALLAWQSRSLELLLTARLLQGLGAAGPRVVAMAIVRDLYSGRVMAQLMSLVMMIFTLVPAIAPTLGAAIMHFTGWRGIFGAFVVFSTFGALWLAIRQCETLPVEKRRPLQARMLYEAAREVVTHPVVRITIAVQTLTFGILFAMLSSAQQLFDITYGRGDEFPLWFGGIAIVAGSANILNAKLVVRLGMRFMVRSALAVQIVIAGLVVVILATGVLPLGAEFALFILWMVSVFFMIGLVIGNLNAIAMEPMGHIAGMAASMTGAIATVLAVLIAAPIGLAFNGTALPLAIGIFICAVLGLALMHLIRREPLT